MSVNSIAAGRGITGWLEIDQSPCRALCGLKPHGEWMRDRADAARQAALEGIARRVREGGRMARIESGEDAIVQMAIDKNTAPDQGELVLAPIAPPVIRYHPGRGALVDLNA